MKTTLFATLFLFLGVAWADSSKGLKPEQIRSARKIAINTILVNEEMHLLDRSAFINKVSGTAAFAVATTLDPFFGGIVSNKQRKEFLASLGGNVDSLSKMLNDFPIMNVFNDAFCQEFNVTIEKVCPEQIQNLGIEIPPFFRGKGLVPNNVRLDYRVLKSAIDADLVVEIRFVYGIAGYGGNVSPIAVIASEVSVVETNKNKLLENKHIYSDEIYKEGHKVDELIAGGTVMFEKEITQAIKGLAHLVAAELGTELSLEQKSSLDSEK